MTWPELNYFYVSKNFEARFQIHRDQFPLFTIESWKYKPRAGCQMVYFHT
jgi:hypothetical protein